MLATIEAVATGTPGHVLAKARARVRLVGPIQAISVHGDDLTPRSRKARAAFAMCCLSPGQKITRAELAATLWDRVPPVQQRASLRQVVLELMPKLGPKGAGILNHDRFTISIAPNSVWVDAVAIMELAQRSTGREAADLLAGCQGILLDGFDEVSKSFHRWLAEQRDRYRVGFQTVLQMEQERCAAGNLPAEDRIRISRSLLQIDPALELSSRILMEALAESGDNLGAISEFSRCEKALKDRLGRTPSKETIELAATIRSSPHKFPRKRHVTRVASEPVPQVPRHSNRRLSVAVLPFDTVGTPTETLLPAVVAHDVAAALARFRWFDVIMPAAKAAAGSVQRRRAEAFDESKLASVKADYALTGSIGKNGDGVRVAVQLWETGGIPRSVWSDVFTLSTDHIAEFSDRITSLVAARVDPLISFVEGQSDRTRNSSLPNATTLATRAIALLHTNHRPEVEEAGRLFERALAIDPNNAMAASWYAFWHMEQFGQGWSTDVQLTIRTINDLSLRAMRADPLNGEATGMFAHYCSFYKRDFETGVRLFDQALNLNPNSALVWLLSVPTYCYIGQPEEALRRVRRYKDLAPSAPYSSVFETIQMIPLLLLRRFREAAALGRHAIETKPNFINGYKPLIAALGHLGLKSEARSYLDRLLVLEPTFSVSQFLATYPLCRDRDRRLYASGLKRAGAPA